MHATCPWPHRARLREAIQARLACAMLFLLGMKPVFFLAFLALGPALAPQFPLLRPAGETKIAVAVAERAPHSAALAVTPMDDAERALLCGR